MSEQELEILGEYLFTLQESKVDPEWLDRSVRSFGGTVVQNRHFLLSLKTQPYIAVIERRKDAYSIGLGKYDEKATTYFLLVPKHEATTEIMAELYVKVKDFLDSVGNGTPMIVSETETKQHKHYLRDVLEKYRTVILPAYRSESDFTQGLTLNQIAMRTNIGRESKIEMTLKILRSHGLADKVGDRYTLKKIN